MDHNPLISVVVVTFNSSDTIQQTLVSILNQNYEPLELIISDDCSTDNTLEIVNKWKINFQKSFHNVRLITSNINTGVTANCNRGLNKASGEWIKFIAGDDLLLPNCLRLNINFVKENPEAKFIFSKYNYLKNNEILDKYYYCRSFFRKNNSNQFKTLIRGIGVNTPTMFLHRTTLLKLNGFNNKYPFLEDYPLWVKASKAGYKLFGFETSTVLYRIHGNNSCLSSPERFINLKYYESKKQFYKDELYGELRNHKYFLSIFSKFIEFLINDIVIKRGNKKKNYTVELKMLSLLNLNRIIGLNGYFNKHNEKYDTINRYY